MSDKGVYMTYEGYQLGLRNKYMYNDENGIEFHERGLDLIREEIEKRQDATIRTDAKRTQPLK